MNKVTIPKILPKNRHEQNALALAKHLNEAIDHIHRLETAYSKHQHDMGDSFTNGPTIALSGLPTLTLPNDTTKP